MLLPKDFCDSRVMSASDNTGSRAIWRAPSKIRRNIRACYVRNQRVRRNKTFTNVHTTQYIRHDDDVHSSRHEGREESRNNASHCGGGCRHRRGPRDHVVMSSRTFMMVPLLLTDLGPLTSAALHSATLSLTTTIYISLVWICDYSPLSLSQSITSCSCVKLGYKTRWQTFRRWVCLS